MSPQQKKCSSIVESSPGSPRPRGLWRHCSLAKPFLARRKTVQSKVERKQRKCPKGWSRGQTVRPGLPTSRQSPAVTWAKSTLIPVLLPKVHNSGSASCVQLCPYVACRPIIHPCLSSKWICSIVFKICSASDVWKFSKPKQI